MSVSSHAKPNAPSYTNWSKQIFPKGKIPISNYISLLLHSLVFFISDARILHEFDKDPEINVENVQLLLKNAVDHEMKNVIEKCLSLLVSR